MSAEDQAAETHPKAQTLLRIVVASYFLAVAIGVIPGVNFTAIALLIAEPQVAAVLTAVVVFSLSYMVMIGWHTRGAALLLGLVTFFAAYLTLIDPMTEANIGAFWRDMALIAALMLTYSDRDGSSSKTAKAGKRRILPRRVRAKGLPPARPEAPKAVFATSRAPAQAPSFTAVMIDLATARANRTSQKPVDLRAPLEAEEIDNIFLDDSTIARAT